MIEDEVAEEFSVLRLFSSPSGSVISPDGLHNGSIALVKRLPEKRSGFWLLL